MMEAVYIPRNDMSTESRATLDLPPVDQPPPYSRPRFPSKPATNASTRKQRGGVATRPECVFRIQVSRQIKRLDYQCVRKRQGRKETFPLDFTCDYLANAENNVFRSWMTGGICPRTWGEPWPSGTERWLRKGRLGGLRGPRIGSCWPHEEYTEPVHGLDLAASRPSGVFNLQWEEEFRWCRDEAEFQSREIDEQQLWQQSFLAIKQSWIENKIWDPRWSEHPGDRWMHEDKEDEIEEHTAASPPPTYDELFGSKSGSDPHTPVEHLEESTSMPVKTTSKQHTPPRTHPTKSARARSHTAPRRSIRVAARNQTRAAASGISKTSQRASAHGRPLQPCMQGR